jgi:hypothetical protein
MAKRDMGVNQTFTFKTGSRFFGTRNPLDLKKFLDG